MNILALLQPIQNSVSKTTLRQLSRVITAMLAMTGRVTMLGMSRWAGAGGSYRTIQRFFYTAIPWPQIFWLFFQKHLLDEEDTYLLAGDECVVTKAGKETYGMDYFFSGLLKKAVPSLSFFTLALVSVKQRRSYPIQVEQTVRSPEEKASSQVKKQARKAKSDEPKRKRGRPKGSCNKKKAEVTLNPELQHIQKMVQALLGTVRGRIRLVYLVMDGHFGNHPALQMVRQCQLHLISKLRSDAALFFTYVGPAPKRGPRPRLGERLDCCKIPEQYLKTTLVEDGIETRIYQLQVFHREFLMPLNVVVLIKTNLETKRCAHVILFSSDLDLAYNQLIDYYSLRFQIEFNFRDAKQYWGLEDFMNVTQTAVTNAANLSLFSVDLSQVLMCKYRKDDPNFSVLDLKAYYRGYRYVIETIKILPQLPDENLVSQLFQKVTALGRIHPAKLPAFSG
ncbi:MAG TPA: transposase [Anaerolineaceae bacterium]|jgi:IS4 transposase|nr:transposase [Anaerolineaceae bacterium]HQH87038.1 transposase [Anaerolineaceae bacterium]